MKDVKEFIAPRLRKLREQKNWRIREAAEAIGVGATAYGNWEQGIRAPRYAEVERAAKVYDVTPEYLVGWTDRDFSMPSGQTFFCPGKRHIEVDGQTIDVKNPCLESAVSRDFLNKANLDNNLLMNIYAPDDAMTGVIEKGDEIMINRAETVPAYTNLFAILMHDNVWVRRIRPEPDGSYTMEANNKSIQPDTKIKLEDIKILGRIVRVCRNL